MDILILEDDAMVRKALSHHLLEAGHGVRVASNGLEAVEMLKHSQRPDVVICDVMLPELSGPGFLFNLERAHEAMPFIIMMSVLKDGEEFIHRLNIHCDVFMRKPIDMVKLDKVLDELRQSRLKRA